MSDADVAAIVVYLRTVPAVSHAVPKAACKAAPLTALSPVWHFHGPGRDSTGRGRYIATALSQCTEWHSPVTANDADGMIRLDEGGRVF